MGKDIIISVIVPIYNVEKVLHRCIDSICSQTYKNLEILLVDDGSTDQSADICDMYAYKDERIKVYHLVRAGVANARNFALDRFVGEYCVFVDSDDFVESTYIERMLYAVQSAGVLLGTCHNLDYHCGETISKSDVRQSDLQVIKLDQYKYISSYAHYVCWAAIYHRSIVNEIRFRADLKVGEDTFFFANALKKAGSVVDIAESLYYHIHYAVSLAQGIYDNEKYTEVLAWKMVCELFQDQSKTVYDSCRAALAIRCYWGMRRSFMSSLLKQEYSDELLKIMKQNCKQVIKSKISFKDKVLYLWACIFPRAFETFCRVRLHGK